MCDLSAGAADANTAACAAVSMSNVSCATNTVSVGVTPCAPLCLVNTLAERIRKAAMRQVGCRFILKAYYGL